MHRKPRNKLKPVKNKNDLNLCDINKYKNIS
jgi:hypothetical protein